MAYSAGTRRRRVLRIRKEREKEGFCRRCGKVRPYKNEPDCSYCKKKEKARKKKVMKLGPYWKKVG